MVHPIVATPKDNTVYKYLIDIVKLMGNCSKVYHGLLAAQQTTTAAISGSLAEQGQALENIANYCTTLSAKFKDFEKIEENANQINLAEEYNAVWMALDSFNLNVINPLRGKKDDGALVAVTEAATEAARVETIFKNINQYKQSFEAFIPNFEALKTITESDYWSKLNDNCNDLNDLTSKFTSRLSLAKYFYTFLAFKDKAAVIIAVGADANKYRTLATGGKALCSITSTIFLNKFNNISHNLSKYLPESAPWDAESLDSRLQILQVFIGLLMPDSDNLYSPIESSFYDSLREPLNAAIDKLTEVSLDTLEKNLSHALSKTLSPSYNASTVLLDPLRKILNKSSVQNFLKKNGVSNYQDYLKSAQLCLSAYAGDLIPAFVHGVIGVINAQGKTYTKEVLKNQLRTTLDNGDIRKYMRDQLTSNLAGFLLNENEFRQLNGSFDKPPRVLWADAATIRGGLGIFQADTSTSQTKSITTNLVIAEASPAANIAVPQQESNKIIEAENCHKALRGRKEIIKKSILACKTLADMDEIFQGKDFHNFKIDIHAAEETFYLKSGVIKAGEFFQKTVYQANGESEKWSLAAEIELELQSAADDLYGVFYDKFFKFFSIEEAKPAELGLFNLKLNQAFKAEPKNEFSKKAKALFLTAFQEKKGFLTFEKHSFIKSMELLNKWSVDLAKLKGKSYDIPAFAELYTSYKSSPYGIYNHKTNSYHSLADQAVKQIYTLYLLAVLAASNGDATGAYQKIYNRKDNSLLSPNSFGKFVNSKIKNAKDLSSWYETYIKSLQAETATVSISEPVKPVVEPVEPVVEPVEPVVEPVEPVVEPGKPAVEPGKPAVEPGKPAVEPGKPAVEPGKPAVEPGKPAVEPGKPAVEPGKPAVEPGKPAVEPGKPAVEPGKPAVEPGKPAVEPGKPAVEPGKPAVEPGKPAVEPDKPSVEPVKPAVKPSKPAVKPAKPSAEPNKLFIPKSEEELREDVIAYIAKRNKTYVISDKFSLFKRMTKNRKLKAAQSLLDSIDFHNKLPGKEKPKFDIAALSEGELGKLVKKHKDKAELKCLNDDLAAAKNKRFWRF